MKQCDCCKSVPVLLVMRCGWEVKLQSVVCQSFILLNTNRSHFFFCALTHFEGTHFEGTHCRIDANPAV